MEYGCSSPHRRRSFAGGFSFVSLGPYNGRHSHSVIKVRPSSSMNLLLSKACSLITRLVPSFSSFFSRRFFHRLAALDSPTGNPFPVLCYLQVGNSFVITYRSLDLFFASLSFFCVLVSHKDLSFPLFPVGRPQLPLSFAVVLLRSPPAQSPW